VEVGADVVGVERLETAIGIAGTEGGRVGVKAAHVDQSS